MCMACPVKAWKHHKILINTKKESTLNIAKHFQMLSRLFPWNGHSRAIQMDSQSGLDIDNSKRRQIFFSIS